MEHDTATVTLPQLYVYLKAFLCMVMIDKKHSCIVDQHVQWKVQLMVLVCKGLDGPAAVLLCITSASAWNLPLQLAEQQQLQSQLKGCNAVTHKSLLRHHNISLY